jgi:3'-phosphoadenosine 5'-phosphosulfate sulfotransferase (PAPS reductase)/FAD synthetase
MAAPINGGGWQQYLENKKHLEEKGYDFTTRVKGNVAIIEVNELPILVSFSGGRTSAFMVRYLRERFPNRKLIILFANTGKEREETLDFVHECDTRWNLGVIWIEADVNPEIGKGTGFKVVTYETASRNGEPFDAVNSKYGLANIAAPTCTRELKTVPLQKYMASLGYDDWLTAMGIRYDERHRATEYKDRVSKPFYPLADEQMRVDKGFIRRWWDRQPFELGVYIQKELFELHYQQQGTYKLLFCKPAPWQNQYHYDKPKMPHHLDTETQYFIPLKDYEGNCVLCYKKSFRKLLTLVKEQPQLAPWYQQQQKLYSEGQYTMFREGRTIDDLITEAGKPFEKVMDEHELVKMNPPMFDPYLDKEFDCFCKST